MIKEAAIQRKSDGKVWTGYRHSDVYKKIDEEMPVEEQTEGCFIQGFVTVDGKFVDRCEAHKIATECKQIPDRVHDLFDILISEDLY